MAGFSIFLVMGVLSIIIIGILILLAIIGIECFIGATVISIVYIIKREDLKKNGNKIWLKISIPIVMYLISFSTFMLYLFMFIIYNMNQL